MKMSVTVNEVSYEREVEPRLLLSDFLRQDLGLTGTHVGCEHGVCGACTVLFDGEPARSCIMLAVQADGHDLQTVEGLASADGELHPLQAAFRECARPAVRLLHARHPDDADGVSARPSAARASLRFATRSRANLCRCTGYQHIVDAVHLVPAEALATLAPASCATKTRAC